MAKVGLAVMERLVQRLPVCIAGEGIFIQDGSMKHNVKHRQKNREERDT